MNLKILIADAHSISREGLRAILSKHDGFEVLAAVNHAKALSKELSLELPEVLIIDHSVQGAFSIHDLKNLRQEFPDLNILVISASRDREEILNVLDQGIYGYLLKECDEDEIISAVRSVSRKEKFFCGKIMDIILQQVSRQDKEMSDAGQCSPVYLSSRELEIVRLIAAGLTTKDIAAKLHLSFFTVGTHRKNIFRKLQVRNSSELILLAIKEKLVDPLKSRALQTTN
jgi:DNA-binding NarL/FixJ family response regulator